MNTYNPQLDGHHQILRDMLTEAREAKQLFQKDVAEKLRKNQAFVSKYEAGERKLNVLEVLNLLEVLGVDELVSKGVSAACSRLQLQNGDCTFTGNF